MKTKSQPYIMKWLLFMHWVGGKFIMRIKQWDIDVPSHLRYRRREKLLREAQLTGGS